MTSPPPEMNQPQLATEPTAALGLKLRPGALAPGRVLVYATDRIPRLRPTVMQTRVRNHRTPEAIG